MFMAGRTFNGRVQHLRDGGLGLQPLGQFTGHAVVRGIAKLHAGQRTQNRLDVICPHPQAQPHMRELDLHVQSVRPGHHTAHQHVAAPAGVFGERVGRHIHTQRAIAQQIKWRKSQSGAPGVVQSRENPALTANAHLGNQIGKLHRHRARGLQPDQPRFGRDALGQVVRIQGIEKCVGDAITCQLHHGKVFARAVRVVGDQNFIARFQQRQTHGGNGSQTAGHEHAFGAAFQLAQTFFQQKGGGRAVQAVGVAALVFPVAGAHGGHVGEDDGGGLEHARLGRCELSGGRVGVVDEAGGDVGCRG